jgi:hypothetical protein
MLALSVGYYSDHKHPDIHIGVGAPTTLAKRASATGGQHAQPERVGRDWDYREPESSRVALCDFHAPLR